MSIQPYFLGCPLWNERRWLGRFFPTRSADTLLSHYARCFNAVEGNTTFYATPSATLVLRWRDQTPETFRFMLKLPRQITHILRLHHAERAISAFLKRVAPLGKRLGPIFIQLPATFGPEDLPVLGTFLQGLSKEYNYAVEVRHLALFDKSQNEQRLHEILRCHGAERVILDPRALFSAPALDEATRRTQARKPKVPVPMVHLSQSPIVRFIGHPNLAENDHFLQPWLDKFAAWIRQGKRPYLFCHMPDNVTAPALAQGFHAQLAVRVPGLEQRLPNLIRYVQADLFERE